MSCQIKKIEANSFFLRESDEKKVWEDIQIILDVVLTIIICLGSSNLMSPVIMGGIVISIACVKAMIAIVAYKQKDSKENHDIASTVISIFYALSLIAIVVLSGLTINGQMDGNTFSMYAFGIDLISLFVRATSQRICGLNKQRYSCFQRKAPLLQSIPIPP